MGMASDMTTGGESTYPYATQLAATWPAADTAPRPSAELEAALTGAIEAARTAWPALAMDEHAFIDHIARALAKATGEPASEVRQLHAGDLFLAWGCGRADRAAMEAFHDRHLAQLDAELRQHLCDRLFVPSRGAPPRIWQYAGRAPLARWMAIVIRHAALGQRIADPRLQFTDEETLEQFVMSSPTPELDVLRGKYRAAIEHALRVALAGLRPRDRCILRLTLIKRASLAKVGTLYGVDPSTVWHWLVKIRRQLREEIEHHLLACGLPTAELPSVLRALASQIDVGSSAWGTTEPAADATAG